MSREEKLKAAKEKLVRFQKKRSREEKNNITPVAQIIPIDSSEDQNPEEPHISTESFQELNLLPPAPSLEILDHQEFTTNNQDNVSNYYDLYISESNNCEMLSIQLHECQKAYQQVLNENEALKNQITSLETHLQSVLVTKSIECEESNEIEDLKSSLAKDSENIKILEIEMAKEREKLEENWSKISEKEESLYRKEKELFNLDNELKQRQQAQDAISDQNYSGNDIDNIKQQSDVNDNSLQWLEYYQGKCAEFEQINSQLNEQLQIYQNQPTNHNQNEIILEEILNLKKDFKSFFEPYEKINQIEEMNRKIVHILETSSINAPSDFCKAIVELSRYDYLACFNCII
jgi:hypothetical protein